MRVRVSFSDVRRQMVLALVCACLAVAPARATTVAPPPCDGALPLYTRVGIVEDVDGAHRRAADVEARLAIIRNATAHARAVRLGFAYVDAEGDVWVAIDAADARARNDWRHVAPGLAQRSPAYALVERVGIPRGYRLSACTP